MAEGGVTAVAGPERDRTRAGAVAAAARLAAPALVVWLAAGAALSQATGRVVDWFVMTDELLYERLAIAVARTGSPLPEVHGELVPNVSQLYPVLVAPFFRGSLVPEALHDAHVLNAFLITSAAVPAYLLARRVTRSAWLAGGVAALSVAVPWLVYASFLLTEVAAYPAFLWAVLAIQRAVTEPRPLNDALALLAVAVAVLARTQFVVLLAVLPVAIVVERRAIRSHRVLAAAYAVLALAAVALAATGRLASALGVYRAAGEGDLVPSGLAGSSLEHVAAVALGAAVVPFLVGAGWAVATLVRPGDRERGAFAAVATTTLAAMVVLVASFDLRFVDGAPNDRYLFYVVPLVFVAFAAALADAPPPWWALLAPAALAAAGFATLPLPTHQRLNVDRPLAVVHEHLLAFAGSAGAARATLAVGVVVLAVLVLAGWELLGRRRLAVVLGALALLAVPSAAAATFVRLFTVGGTSGRPVTLDQGVVFNWIDRAVGFDADVTAIPYPMIPGDYWAGTAYWWDVQFWNASVTRTAWRDAAFGTTPNTFAKLDLRFDPETGRANATPTPYVAQASGDARFRLAGRRIETARGVELIEAARPWRAEWVASGLYPDGWTDPRREATIRVFAPPGQDGEVTRVVTVMLRAPAEAPPRPYRLASATGEVRGEATADATAAQVSVCLPADGHADVTLTAEGATTTYGVPLDSLQAGVSREVGVFVVQIALADERGPAC